MNSRCSSVLLTSIVSVPQCFPNRSSLRQHLVDWFEYGPVSSSWILQLHLSWCIFVYFTVKDAKPDWFAFEIIVNFQVILQHINRVVRSVSWWCLSQGGWREVRRALNRQRWCCFPHRELQEAEVKIQGSSQGCNKPGSRMKVWWATEERKGTSREEQRCGGGVGSEGRWPQCMSDNIIVEAITLGKGHSLDWLSSSEDMAHDPS